MSLPLMTMVPYYFMEMLAEPVVMVTESPALITKFFGDFQRIVTAHLRTAITVNLQ